MTIKNTVKCGLIFSFAVANGLSAATAAPSPLASQSDFAKMWSTGGVMIVPKVAVSGQSFKSAASFTSPKKMANSWNAQSGTNPKIALRQGEKLLATFFVRAAKPASGKITFSVEGGPKYDRLAWQDIDISNKWKKVSVPFASKGTYGPRKWQVTFKMGSVAQTVQIANFQLIKRA